MAGDDGRVVEQDAGGLAGGLGRGDHRVQRVEVARVVEPTGNAKAVRQVGRADEQDVDAIDGDDLSRMLDGAWRFDLDDPEEAPVDRGHVAVPELAHAGAARRQSQAADAVGPRAGP